ncbi:ABC transporter permease [Parenemella sanctibonifatiensis]|uniref:Polysaccharide ABC transporter ATP-binding protein n=1 Tax=Parenemella sanctibonifatiensis TaxID=2016505 RepID=A0A255DZE1_9ACTN|nr:ABC transporter permease subunit [Parenemella sanctibonifatiensis]OYN84606.1 polysaccharide ABC transporter ATP-binding protein [Parenemella sanctibonifatiensis]
MTAIDPRTAGSAVDEREDAPDALDDATSTKKKRGKKDKKPTGVALLENPRKKSFAARFRNDWPLLLFALPGVIYFVTFHYLPLLGNVIAFKDYQPFIGILESDWVGFENFEIIFNGDPQFLNALANTMIITFLQLVFTFPAPIILALLMNAMMNQTAKRIVQSILYLPHFLSWVVVVALFQSILGYNGPLWHGMAGLDLGEPNIIGNPDVFKPLLIIQDIWKSAGWGTILFLAALAGIDAELYEAAAVDGASKWSQLWNVTLPGIRPVIILLLILRIGDILSVGFEQIQLQQNAVGIQASEVLDTYVYNNGIVAGGWGESAAVGLVKGVLAVILVLGANKLAHVFGEAGIYQGADKA